MWILESVVISISLHSGCLRGSLCAFVHYSYHQYLPSQLETLVPIVIAIVHFVVALSENHPAHHYSQVDAFRSEVKLLHLGNTEKATLLNKVTLYFMNKC